MLEAIREFLKGKKTYITMTISILGASVVWSEGLMTNGEFLIAVLAALGFIEKHLQSARLSKGEKK